MCLNRKLQFYRQTKLLNWVSSILESVWNLSTTEFIVLFGSIALAGVLIFELIERKRQNKRKYKILEQKNTRKVRYKDIEWDTDNDTGIVKANKKRREKKLSPINIDSGDVISMFGTPLTWSPEYDVMPTCIHITNNGRSVVLRPKYLRSSPKLFNGALSSQYDLYNIRFRWGPSDDLGSEHSIDNNFFVLEMQAVHIKAELDENHTESHYTDDNNKDLVTNVDNPYLEPLISGLKNIRKIGSRNIITSFPMSWLLPRFENEYYVYSGSLTFPPSIDGVKWVIKAAPICISHRQVGQFRRIRTLKGPSITDGRPNRYGENRQIYFYTSAYP